MRPHSPWPTMTFQPHYVAIGIVALSVVVAGTASDSMAQRVVAPDSVDSVSTGGEQAIDDQTDSDDEAQESEDDSPFPTFDDVQVRRVKPDEIPDFRPGLPSGSRSRMNSSDLPRSLSGAQLEAVSRDVAAATVELIAVQRPPEHYRQTDMIYRGHAVWVSPSASGADPILISTADWLTDADEIYAVTGEVSQALSKGGVELGGHRPQPLDDVMADRRDLLDRSRSDLVELHRLRANQHVNLSRLAPVDGAELRRPDQGLVMHDMDSILPGAIFGYSPAVGTTVTPISYHDSDSLERQYAFYFLVDFRAILGAPIVTSEGKLLAINALRYPEDPTQSLAIPPGAIHAFIDAETERDDGDHGR